MIPFGPFHPDKSGMNTPVSREAINCMPLAGNAFQPLRSLAPGSDALTGECIGAATVFDDDGDVHTFAGDATKLYKLGADLQWNDVSRTSGGPYASGSGERWNFASSGSLVIATTITDAAQKYLLGTSTNFEALGGGPPKARYIANIRDFIFLGGIFENERRVQWSGLANPENWTPGSQNSGFQDFQNGGPIRGLLGGEVGYIFQAQNVTRATFVPGSEVVFQFDQIEGGRGLEAPASLVRIGQEAYYYGGDNFYRMNLGGGGSVPIGVGKWARWFADEVKSGSESQIIGGIDPPNRLIVWAFESAASVNSTPDRIILYDWALDEAAIGHVSVKALATLLTPGFTIDTMDAFGSIDELPFSLDSPVWRGGRSVMGVFSLDNRLSYLTGDNLAAKFVSSDGFQDGRQFINGVRPIIDTSSATVALSVRERHGDPVTFRGPTAQSSTGYCPQHASGNVIRACVESAAGADWTRFEGVMPRFRGHGRR